MKHRKPISFKQVLFIIFALVLFTAITLFLFCYKRDEKVYTHLSSHLFREEMLASTLNMHYTLATPADYGIYRYDPVLPCYNALQHLRNQASTENLLASLRKVDASRLSEQDAYSYQLLQRYLTNSLELNSYPYYEDPLSPGSGMQSQLPILLAEYTFRCKQDVTDYLCLLAQTDEYFSSLLRYEQEKQIAGHSLPASSLRKTIEQCDTIVTKESLTDGTHFLQSTFRERILHLTDAGILTPSEGETFCAKNNQLLQEVFLPAYEHLGDGLFLLIDKEASLSGLASKPQGAEYYRCLLRAETGSYRDVEALRELLYETFNREFECMKILAETYPERFSKTAEWNIDFPYTTPEEMLAHLQTRMASDFPALPSVNVTVKEVSSSLEEYCAPAFYLTPPLDDTDNNVIYINNRTPTEGLELYTTLAHEGYPGHLYQTVYCNQAFCNNRENPVREILWYGGYLEGWALYVEFISFDYAADLMRERGKESEAILIEMEKHNRSLQLCLYSLLDIMIHYDNAPYTQIAQVLNKVGISEESSIQAVYSYIAEEPCNYPKYYLGYLEILELKKMAENLWQDAYSDYLFHKFYLDCGPSDFTSLAERLASETVRKY